MNRLRKHPSNDVRRLVKHLVRYIIFYIFEGMVDACNFQKRIVGELSVQFNYLLTISICFSSENGRRLLMNG